MILLKHFKLYEKIFELNMVEINIIYSDHKGIIITKDRSPIELKFEN